MRSLAVVFGAMAAALLPGLPGWALAVGLAAACAGLAALSRAGTGLILCAMCLLTWLSMQEVQRRSIVCSGRVIAEARIVDVPQPRSSGWAFHAMVRHPREAGHEPLHVRIDFPRQGTLRPQAGETWQLLLSYAEGPEAQAAGNPGRSLLRNKVHARARVLPSPLNLRLAPATGGLLQLRARVSERILARVSDPSAAALLVALAVGVTGEVSDRQWRVFSATGISHLVAISGMHVTFFAMLVMSMARRLWGAQQRLLRKLRRETFAAAIGLPAAAAYALLSGFSVPAQRTLVMLVAFVLLRESARESRACHTLAVATVLILCFDPLAVLDAGFWLSFVAVAAIVLLPGRRLLPAGALAQGADVQIAVSLALLPLTLVLFGLFSVSGLLVNVVAIPVFTLVLVPCVLVATLGYLLPGTLPSWVADRLVDLGASIAKPMWTALTWIADLPGATWQAEPGVALLVVASLSVGLALLPLGIAVRISSLVLLGWSFLAAQPLPARYPLEVEVFNLGAATSVLVRTAHHAVLLGTAETFGSGGRRFEASLLPLLRRRLAGPPQLFVTETPNRDRLAALGAAQALFAPGETLGVHASGRTLPPEIAPCTHRRWVQDAVEFELHQPGAGRGCVLVARLAGRLAVLPLDLDASGWRTSRGVDDVPADILLLPRRAWPLSPSQWRGRVAEGATIIAGIGSREQDTAGWKGWLRDLATQRLRVITTAQHGSLRLAITADGSIVHIRHPFARWLGRFGYHARPCGKSCWQVGPSCGPSSFAP